MIKRLASVLGVICILSLICAEAKEQPKTPSAEPQVLRVMTYNIHHGRGLDGTVNIERIAEVIKTHKADIVGLQELDRGVERSGRKDLPAELAKLTGMHIYFDKNISYQGGDYGNAILSKYPFLQRTNTYYKMLRPKEQRGLQQAVLDVKGRQVLIFNTHIDYRPEDEERLMNIVEIKDALKRYPDLPTFLTLDMNDQPKSRTHQGISEAFTDVWETVGEGPGITHIHPTDNRHQRIDLIFYKKSDALKPVKAWVVETPASDHRPVVAEFILK